MFFDIVPDLVERHLLLRLQVTSISYKLTSRKIASYKSKHAAAGVGDKLLNGDKIAALHQKSISTSLSKRELSTASVLKLIKRIVCKDHRSDNVTTHHRS